MIRKRTFFALGLIASLTLLAWLIVWLISLEPGISRANYVRIQLGMTQSEVEDLLAGPPRLAPTRLDHWASRLDNGFGHKIEVWADDDAGIRVFFDEAERVVLKQWIPRRPSLLDRIRAWLED